MIILLSLLAFLLPAYLVRFEVFGIPSTLLEVLIYLVFLIGLVRLITTREPRRPLWSRRVWLWPAGLMLLSATVGVFVSPDLRTALGLWKGFILDPILVYLLLLAFVRDLRDLRMLTGGLVAGGLVVSVWALIEYLAPGTSRTIGPYDLDPNASPNYLAFALAPLVPLAVWLSRRASSTSEVDGPLTSEVFPARMLLSWIVVGSLVAAIVVSGSRAGVAAAVGGLVLTVLLSMESLWRSKLAKGLLVAGLLLAMLASWWVVKPDFTLHDDGSRTVTSTNVRFQIWAATGELVRTHPVLGTGLGHFQEAFGELTAGRVNFPEFITPWARTPHSLFVGMWMELGLIGLIGLIGAVVLVGRTLFRAVRSPENRAFAAALLGAWFVLLGQGLVDMPIWKNDGMILFWILVAAAGVLAELGHTHHRKTEK